MPGCRAADASQRKKEKAPIPSKGTMPRSRAKDTSKGKETCSARKENAKGSGEGSVKFPQLRQKLSARGQIPEKSGGGRKGRRAREREKNQREREGSR